MKCKNALFIIGLLVCCVNVVAQTTVTLDVPFFSQRDARWSGDILGPGPYTIGSDGCTMTAASMVIAMFGFDVNPQTYNTWLTNNNGYTTGSLFYWSKIGGYTDNVVRDAGPSGTIKDEVDRGYPVIAKTDYFEQHWVVIVGYEEDGQNTNYFINDPLQLSGPTTLSYNLTGDYHYVIAPVPGGYYSGWHAGISDRILTSYTANGGQARFGTPWNNSSFGAYVHPWPDDANDPNVVWLQDFIEPDGHWWQIVDNPAAGQAFPVHGQILTYWYNNWGYRDFGPPESNEYYATHESNGHQLVVQTFARGYITYDTVTGVAYATTEPDFVIAGGPDTTPTPTTTPILPDGNMLQVTALNISRPVVYGVKPEVSITLRNNTQSVLELSSLEVQAQCVQGQGDDYSWYVWTGDQGTNVFAAAESKPFSKLYQANWLPPVGARYQLLVRANFRRSGGIDAWVDLPFSGDSSQFTVVAAPQPTPTFTPTLTSTLIPTFTATPTPTFTLTATPTETSTPTFTPTVTDTPGPTATVTATDAPESKSGATATNNLFDFFTIFS